MRLSFAKLAEIDEALKTIKEEGLSAFSTWKEVSHVIAATGLLKGGFSIIVADETENFEQPEEDDERIVSRGVPYAYPAILAGLTPDTPKPATLWSYGL